VIFLLEILFAKEARDQMGCKGKPLDCSKELYIGLQCDYKGDLAPNMATYWMLE